MDKQIDIEKTLGYQVHQLAFNMKSMLKSVFKNTGYDITPEAYFLLNLIPETGIEQGELVKKTGKDKAAITRLLDWLSGKSWIIRRVVPDNKRKAIIKISPQGKEVLVALNKALSNISQPMMKGISKNEHMVLMNAIKQLDDNLLRIVEKLNG